MGDVVKMERKKAATSDHNQMLIDRIRGASVQAGTPETDKDLQNPNVK